MDRPFLEWLRVRLQDELGSPIQSLQISGEERPAAGQSNDTLLFSASWDVESPFAPDNAVTSVATGVTGRRIVTRELVLRRQPTGNQIFMTPDVIREARILQGLERLGRVPVPHILGFEADPAVAGGPFFVMERIYGRVPLARPSIHSVGWLPTLAADQRRTMWNSAMDVLVGVHATDWSIGHSFLLDGSDASGALDRHLDRLAEWYRWTVAGRSFPITDAALERLVAERRTVSTSAPVLVWGDARVGNMIFGDDHHVAAAIDWEVATIGPRAIDLAHWLFFDEFATTAEGVPRLSGWPDRKDTIAEYERRSGVTVVDLDYFELMEEFFMATTVIRQADMRVEKGLSKVETRMGHDNTITQMLARRLGLPLPDVSPDFVAHRSGKR